MYHSDISLEKFWVTQSGYFRLATTAELSMGITYGAYSLSLQIGRDSE